MKACFNILNFSESNVSKSQSVSTQTNTMFNKKLKDFLDSENILDAAKLKNEWFSEIDAKIFISYSHKDWGNLKTVTEKLKEKEIPYFIDSESWGYADDLLREIDEDDEYYKKNGCFYYPHRNQTTAFVHILLNTAILKMLEKCDYVFFFNTNKSVPKKDLNGDNFTFSPWIYSENAMCNAILRERKKAKPLFESVNFATGQEALRTKLPMEFDEFIDVDYQVLKSWLEDEEEGITSLEEFLSERGKNSPQLTARLKRITG